MSWRVPRPPSLLLDQNPHLTETPLSQHDERRRLHISHNVYLTDEQGGLDALAERVTHQEEHRPSRPATLGRAHRALRRLEGNCEAAHSLL